MHHNIHVGKEYGRLTLLERIGGKRETRWWCRCKCGNERIVNQSSLTSGHTTSCGCLKRETAAARSSTHGGATRGAKRSRLYRIWCAMKTRCMNKNFRHYEDYGGRGIRICDEWQDFTAFREWAMANGYADNLTIEREDVDGDYKPSNCKWIPQTKQSRNRRDTKMLTAFGETKGIADWAEDPRCVVPFGTMKSRIYRDGWPAEKAISTPTKRSWSRRKKDTVA
jgi:hypothetical protein